MAKKVTVENLGAEVDKILAKYGDEIEENLDKIRHSVALKGKTALKNASESDFNGSGKYAAGWTVTDVKYPHYTSSVIHNKKAGLPHLLEHGHALIIGGRNVGRVEGREHIAPVEEELINQYVNEVVSKL